MRFAPRLCLAMLLLSTMSCSYSVHQVYIGSMDPGVHNDQGHWVTAETKDFVILGFALDTNYVNNAYRELADKCKGRLAQVTTEHLTAYWFLSYDQKVVLKGLCLSG